MSTGDVNSLEQDDPSATELGLAVRLTQSHGAATPTEAGKQAKWQMV